MEDDDLQAGSSLDDFAARPDVVATSQRKVTEKKIAEK